MLLPFLRAKAVSNKKLVTFEGRAIELRIAGEECWRKNKRIELGVQIKTGQ